MSSSETYTLAYDARVDRAIGNIDRLIAKIHQLDAAVDKSETKLKTLGAGMAGIPQAMSSLGNLGRALGHVDSLADKATAGLKDVGKDTAAMTRAVTKAEELIAHLKALETQAHKTGAAMGGVGGAARGAGGGAGGAPGEGKAGFVKRAATVAAGNLLERAIRATIGAYGHSQQEERDFQDEATGRAMAFRDERRELAGLMGESSPTDEVLRKSTAVMRETGMSGEEEKAFSVEYLGAAAIGRNSGNLGPAGAARDKLEADISRVGAHYGVRAGIDTKTAGAITGIVGAYRKVQSAKDVAGELAGMHYGLEEGLGEMTPLMKSELGQAGSAIPSGRVSGLPELGAFIGIMSGGAKGPGSSGTNYGQLSRLLNQVTGKDADFLKSAGVADQKGDLNKLRALDAFFKKNNIKDPREFLAAQGFGNETDLKAATHALNMLPGLEKQVAGAKKRSADGAGFIRKGEDFQRSRAGLNRRAAAEVEAAMIERGMEGEAMAAIREQGRAHRLGKDHFMPQSGRALTGMYQFGAEVLGAGDADREADDMEGLMLLKQRYKAMGKDLSKRYPELMKQTGIAHNFITGKGRTAGTNQLRVEQAARALKEVEALEKAARDQKEAAAVLKEAAGVLKGAVANIQPPPRPAPPPPPPPGKGAAVPGRG